MAVLDKLLIGGLRSFGPFEEDKQNIKICTPLTLILGENGCGKTTIIEALKFACSGDVPGGSRSGQGFVNDPKLSGMQSIKGQVRLNFTDAQGFKYLIVKSVQLTHKNATSQFKRLDSTLKKTKPDGSFEDISSRCSDIDAVICELLGVSKAIINNVIFCHQENASWPLDEAKKLKEKFDEIFGATEYNKCAETVRKLMKDRDVKNKLLLSKVAMAKQTKEIVDRKRDNLHEKEEKLNALQDAIKEKEENLLPIRNRLKEISVLEDNLSKLKMEYTTLESTKNSIIDQQKSILSNIDKEFIGTDTELQQEINLFQNNHDLLQGNIKSFKNMEQSIENQKKQITSQIDRIQVKLGKLQNEKDNNKKAVAERNSVLEKTFATIGIETVALETNDDVIQNISQIKKFLAFKSSDYKTLAKDCDAQDVQLQDKINTIQNELVKVNHAVESKTQQTLDFQRKTREINSKLRELDYSDEQLKSLQNKITQIESDLKAYRDSFDVVGVSRNIDNDKLKIRQHEEKLEILDRENKILQQNSIIEAELLTLQHGIVKHESAIEVLKNNHYENFNTIFCDEEMPTPGCITKFVEQHKQKSTALINKLTGKLNLKQKEATTFETQRKYQKTLLEKLQIELAQSEQKISELCKGKPFETVCNDLYIAIEKLQKSKGQLDSGLIMYQKFVKEFEKDSPCCPVCETGFANKQNLTKDIVASLRKRIQGIPAELNKVECQLKETQEMHTSVLQLKPFHTKIEELTNTIIPKTVSDVAELDGSIKRTNEELQDLKKELVTPQAIVDACNRVIADSAVIDQHHLQKTRAQSEIGKMQDQLVQVASNRTKRQTEIEIETVKTELNDSRRNCETSQKKLHQHNEECQQLREQRSKLFEKQLDIQKAMQGKPQLQEQLNELSQKQDTLQIEISELQIRINPLNVDLKEAKEVKEDVKKKNREKLDKAQIEINRTQKSVDDINKLQQSIEVYLQRNGDREFESTLNELGTSKQKSESLEMEIKVINHKISDTNKQLASQEISFRNLKDNQDLREKRKMEGSLDIEIEEVKKKIGGQNYKSLLKEKHKKSEEMDILKQDISQCGGITKQLKEDITSIKADLNNPENKQAHTIYKSLLIESKAATYVRNDLEVYLKALEYGILKFHQERMAQINKIIKQLWRSIYRGNDCDYIEIQTDEIKSVGQRRSYNYKVVQKRNGVEIDMRGRCSAGQKVLACLVIRMALAETFSQNCGILALDEPTTNLDRMNIESLSFALERIVNARQVEKNFQLIIITHDQKFLDALTKVDKVSYYWKVTRNEKGCSRIRKVDI